MINNFNLPFLPGAPGVHLVELVNLGFKLPWNAVSVCIIGDLAAAVTQLITHITHIMAFNSRMVA
jgi:hypothetical protein